MICGRVMLRGLKQPFPRSQQASRYDLMAGREGPPSRGHSADQGPRYECEGKQAARSEHGPDSLERASEYSQGILQSFPG
jgi:hypothetical protein